MSACGAVELGYAGRTLPVSGVRAGGRSNLGKNLTVAGQ